MMSSRACWSRVEVVNLHRALFVLPLVFGLVSCVQDAVTQFEITRFCKAVGCDLQHELETGNRGVKTYVYSTGAGMVYLTAKADQLRQALLSRTQGLDETQFSSEYLGAFALFATELSGQEVSREGLAQAFQQAPSSKDGVQVSAEENPKYEVSVAQGALPCSLDGLNNCIRMNWSVQVERKIQLP